MGLDGGGQQLDGVVGKLEKVAEVLGAADEDPGPGGVQPEGIRDFLEDDFSGGVAFWVGDVGPDPLHRTGPGKYSVQGCAADHREEY